MIPSYEELLAWEGGEVVATETGLARRIVIDGRGYCLKTQRFPRWRPRTLFRASDCVREARASLLMAALDVRVPEVHAVGERRRFGFLVDALILMPEIPGAVDLKRWRADDWAPRPGLPPAEAVRRELRETVARVHAAGWRFGDLKPENVLAAPPDAAGRSVVILAQPRFRRSRSYHSDMTDATFAE